MAADTDSALYSWSSTESNNKPTGTTTVGTNWDDNLRMIQKVVRGWLATKGADIASAGTTDLGAIEGYAHDITGTTTITGFGTVSAGIPKVVKFEGALTLTHSATSLILPGAANITTADGDIGLFISEGSGNWRCISYFKASGEPWPGVTSLIATLFPTYGFTTGDVKLTIKTTADSGWVLMNDGTIGNGSSGGTTRANADTSALFTLLWNNTANAECAVSTGRGASAAIDYAANKTIALPKALGRALAAYGAGSGLTSRALAKTVGEETHILTIAEMPSHDHPTSMTQANAGAGGGSAFLGNSSTTGSTGGGGAHENMQPTVFLNVMIKL